MTEPVTPPTPPTPAEPRILTSPPPGATPPLTADAIASAVASAIGGALKPQFDALFAVARGKGDKAEPAQTTPPSPTGRSNVEQLRLDWEFDRALRSAQIDDRARTMLQRLYDAEHPEKPADWLAAETTTMTPATPPQPPAPGSPAPAGADAPVTTGDSVLTWSKDDVDRFVLANGGDPSDPLNIKNRVAYDKISTMLKSALKGRKIRLRATE